MAYLNLANARNENRAQMEEIIALGICPFCREHFEKHHREPIIHESENWILTKNDYPYEGSTGHFLIVTKRHISQAAQLNDQEWKDLKNIFNIVSKHVDQPGGTFIMRFGDTEFTGATLEHLHAHIVFGVSREEGTEPIKQKIGFKKK